MLKRVEIKYFRSCQNVVLDNLGRVIVLAGRNAAGKTNILRAIEWLASVATSAALPKGGVESGNVLLDVLIGDSIYHYSLKVELRQSPSREGPLAALTEELSVEGVDGALTAIFGRKNEEVNLSQTESKIGIGMAAPCMPAPPVAPPSRRSDPGVDQAIHLVSRSHSILPLARLAQPR